MSDPRDFYATPSPLRVAFGGRCPRCGDGQLFSGFLQVAESCKACGLDLKPHDSGDGPAVFVIFIIGFLVVGLAGWSEIKYEPPVWVHVLLWLPLTIGGSLALLRPLKGLLIALQFRHKSGERQDREWQ